jgi:RNA ligase (TIGR02306 family)
MERKLVSIQVVDSIAPIAGADQIEQARVMGWTVVIKKGEFRPGDSCVFFEIDSVLPEGAPWAEFMRPRNFRVRTAKLRGVLSQGLALPVDILQGDVPAVGTDVRERLGVTKFEVVVPDVREMAGAFPTAVPKTDEIRLQSALGVLDEIRGKDFYVSTKLDGSSATFFRDIDGNFVAASRNWTIKPGNNQLWTVAEKYRIAERLPLGFAIQGELCGPGIQKNRLGLDSLDVFIFNVYDVRAGQYLDYQAFLDFCRDHGLKTVPIERVVRGDEAANFDHSLDGWLEASRGLYAGTKSRKEGIVIRPLVHAYSPTLGGRLSFKVINNEFLLKDEG